jgi:ribosomal protein S18 acetylase RimI-like enzyme
MTTNEDLSIRLLHPEDAEDYRKIRLAALADTPEAFGSTYEEESARPLSHFTDRIQNSAVFAAYLNGTIAGMASLARHTGQKESHKAFLWGMYVAPAARGKGAGKALVTAVLNHASTIVEQVILTAVTTNEPAIALYQSLGFKIYGTEPRSLKTIHGYADEHLMVHFCATANP